MDCEKALFYGGSQKGVRMLLSQIVLDQVLQGYHLCYQTAILQSDSHLYLYSHINRQLRGLDGERSGKKFTHAGSCRMVDLVLESTVASPIIRRVMHLLSRLTM
jgi:hypothetical protein